MKRLLSSFLLVALSSISFSTVNGMQCYHNRLSTKPMLAQVLMSNLDNAKCSLVIPHEPIPNPDSPEAP